MESFSGNGIELQDVSRIAAFGLGKSVPESRLIEIAGLRIPNTCASQWAKDGIVDRTSVSLAGLIEDMHPFSPSERLILGIWAIGSGVLDPDVRIAVDVCTTDQLP